jgi:hypothetical protein
MGLKEALAAALLAYAAAGCAVEQPGDERRIEKDTHLAPPDIPAQEQVEEEAPEGSLSAQRNSGHVLSCEEIRPEELGPSTSFITRANGPEADCGPGTGDGAGHLALMNSGPFGATAWNVVSRTGVDTGNLILGGDLAIDILPQPSGFHVIRIPPGGASLTVYSSDGEFLRRVPLTLDDESALDVAADTRGGTLAARWEPGEDGSQVLSFQPIDSKGRPRSEPVVVATAPAGEERFVLGGVDARGRVLLLWPGPEGSATWVGQWLNRNGNALTEPFTFPAPAASFPGGSLKPLNGSGLALRLGEEWVLRFPSGQADVLPAPDWLAAHPGSALIPIRNGRAYALVPPATFVEGSGCRESLLFFASDGTACGELVLPFGGSTCFGRQLGIALDGTVIQQIELGIPANNQCAWRWWPRLLR